MIIAGVKIQLPASTYRYKSFRPVKKVGGLVEKYKCVSRCLALGIVVNNAVVVVQR